jgi:GMP synthase (glutamine-hydrolysing)
MIFQHVPWEPLGTLNPLLKEAGFRIRFVNFGRHPDTVPKLDGYNGLVILGGPMAVYEADKIPHLQVEMRLIEEALKKNIPILGICLGAQMLASVLGSQVRKAPQVELGWYDVHLTEEGKKDQLLSSFHPTEKIFQLHQDMFDPPKTAVHLAWSQLCPGQAFRYGEKVYGFQFHLEADRAMIMRWLNRPESKNFIHQSAGIMVAEQMEVETNLYIHRSLEVSQQIFKKFIEIFDLPEKQILLGSQR